MLCGSYATRLRETHPHLKSHLCCGHNHKFDSSGFAKSAQSSAKPNAYKGQALIQHKHDHYQVICIDAHRVKWHEVLVVINNSIRVENCSLTEALGTTAAFIQSLKLNGL